MVCENSSLLLTSRQIISEDNRIACAKTGSFGHFSGLGSFQRQMFQPHSFHKQCGEKVPWKLQLQEKRRRPRSRVSRAGFMVNIYHTVRPYRKINIEIRFLN